MKVDGTSPDKKYITAAAYYVSDYFAFGLLDSCKDVLYPATGQKAIQTLCGTLDCTPKKWFQYMSDRAPFPIHFHVNKTSTNGSDIHPLDVHITPCNESYSTRASACSCQDCAAACIPVTPPTPKTPCNIIHIDCWYLGFSLAFLAFALFFLIYVICYNIMVQNSLGISDDKFEGYSQLVSSTEVDFDGGINSDGRPVRRRKKRKQPNSSEDELLKVTLKDASCLERLGYRMELFLQRIFSRWGRMCAMRPLIVIALGIIVACVFSAGISLFKVTTDPVKLWSAPGSRARQEKNKFDENFG